MNTRLRTISVAIFFALLFVYFGVNSYRTMLILRHDDGWTSGRQNGRMVIREVRADGPAAGLLQVGDEVVTLQGMATAGKTRDEINNTFRLFAPGEPYTMGILRRRAEQTINGDVQIRPGDDNQLQSNDEGEVREITLRTNPTSLSRLLNRYGTSALIPFVFLLSGAVIFLLKPFDKQAILLALVLGSICAFPDGFRSGTAGMPIWLEWLMRATVGAAFLLFPPAFLHFFLIFPESKPPLSPVLRRFPRAEIYLYLPLLLLFLPFNLYGVAMENFAARRGETVSLDFELWQDFLLRLQLLVYIGGGLASLLVNYKQADEEQRQRMRIVVLGSIAGFLPALIQILLVSLGINNSNSAFLRQLDFALTFLLPLMPLAFIYAILRHKVIPVSFIIRQGMRYVLVLRGFYIVQAVLIFFAIQYVFASGVGEWVDSFGSRADIAATFAACGIAFLIAWLINRKVVPAIDRRFFREAYNAQELLAELGQQVRAVAGVEQLLELVVVKLQRALHTANVTVLLRENASSDFVCAASVAASATSGETRFSIASASSPCKLSGDSFVIERLRRADVEELDVNFADPESWLRETTTLDFKQDQARRSAVETLRQLESRLLLPLKTKDEVLGVISLGAKLSDLPFSHEDKRLLASVANQTAFALENARLVGRMVEEERRRQAIEVENARQQKELEEARQLQLSMLPKCVPQLPGIEIAAYMKPATEVGGDYYDFHVAEDGTLTVAVGDATGHGLKAGTMVTATKSLFNLLAHETDIRQILGQSSRALKQMNLRPLYMALTIIKVKKDSLTISAAGMPSMLIHRQSTNSVEEVAIKGMPLGSVANFSYRQQELKLLCGDTILLMSDGFPERFNEQGEMFDYAEVKAVLAQVAEREPQEIIRHFVETGDVWAGARPQDDDVTFVVLKVQSRTNGEV